MHSRVARQQTCISCTHATPSCSAAPPPPAPRACPRRRGAMRARLRMPSSPAPLVLQPWREVDSQLQLVMQPPAAPSRGFRQAANGGTTVSLCPPRASRQGARLLPGDVAWLPGPMKFTARCAHATPLGRGQRAGHLPQRTRSLTPVCWLLRTSVGLACTHQTLADAAVYCHQTCRQTAMHAQAQATV